MGSSWVGTVSRAYARARATVKTGEAASKRRSSSMIPRAGEWVEPIDEDWPGAAAGEPPVACCDALAHGPAPRTACSPPRRGWPSGSRGPGGEPRRADRARAVLLCLAGAPRPGRRRPRPPRQGVDRPGVPGAARARRPRLTPATAAAHRHRPTLAGQGRLDRAKRLLAPMSSAPRGRLSGTDHERGERGDAGRGRDDGPEAG